MNIASQNIDACKRLRVTRVRVLKEGQKAYEVGEEQANCDRIPDSIAPIRNLVESLGVLGRKPLKCKSAFTSNASTRRDRLRLTRVKVKAVNKIAKEGSRNFFTGYLGFLKVGREYLRMDKSLRLCPRLPDTVAPQKCITDQSDESS
ncbi:MAG: hypothetical protein GXP30_11190 [Verrucomicrobia bacterium]|nr:hypothetical protein [Verrucomicrobiota bacterium]